MIPLPENAEVHQITNSSVVILRVPSDMPMEYQQSPLQVFSVWAKQNGLNPLCIMLPEEGPGLEILNEADMAEHGWFREHHGR